MHATKTRFPTPKRISPIERLLRPFQRFTQTESSGGIVLLAATLVALVWANALGADSYHHLWDTEFAVSFGGWSLEMSLHHLINDGLMVVFFFLVGELASPRAAALPIAAALGGMLVPAALYALVNGGGAAAAGWGIPMATDIAFALGVLALMGPTVPIGLKVFLAALAIVDDLGAVLVIALFYTEDLHLGALAAGGAFLAVLVTMNRLGVRHPGPYALVGFLLWNAVYNSGIHATVAGVLAAMCIPARTRIDTSEFLECGRRILDDFERAGAHGDSVLTNHDQQTAIQAMESTCEEVQAPLQRLEHDLHAWVAFALIPLFALANAGVSLGGDLGAALLHPVTLGVILGLGIGKPLGITLFSWLAVRSGVAGLPAGVSWQALHGVSWLAGIGFTMSLFVGGLAFGDGSPLLDSAKLGILLGSTVTAVVGWILLRRATRGEAV